MACSRPITVHCKSNGHSYLVPCGRCDECAQRRKMNFVFRVEQEKLHGGFKYCYFVSLTYDDKYLPFESFSRKQNRLPVNPVSTGESVLCKYDLIQFFKRYRQFSNSNIRYFACGEYGSDSNTARPHYHIVLFTNDDWKTCCKNTCLSWSYLIAETKSERYKRYALSRKLHKPIKRDSCNMSNRELIGRTQVRSITYKRICYVAKYCNKLLYSSKYVVCPFVLISNKLGDSFLTSSTCELCKLQNRHFTYFENGLPVSIPRYFSRLMFTAAQMEQYNLSVTELSSPPDWLLDSDTATKRRWYADRFLQEQKLVARSRLARYGLLKFYG